MEIQKSTLETMEALGESEAFLALQERISRAAKTDRPVILIGERGTGKELAARRLHLLSRRWEQPYVTLNCASLTPTLIESELFGHEAGAFTGAVRLRRGRFENAHGGSLFLDEAANIPMTAQEKILRVVEYGRMERVGGTDTLRVDVRLIAATNVDLREAARRGEFRQDLLDRLSFEVITLPPLRARREDIMLLAGYFARRMALEMGFDSTPEFSPAALRALVEYPWPGNIRELKNVVERMVYLAGGARIESLEFDPFESPFAPRPEAIPEFPQAPRMPARQSQAGQQRSLPLRDAVRALEIERLREALEDCRHNQRRAAEKLGLTYHQFRGYYRKYQQEFEPE